MKNALLTAVALGALSTAAAAQTEYVWVTNRGPSQNVGVYDIGNLTAPVASVPFTVAPADGSPYGIVGVKGANRVYVAFSETGTRAAKVAVIHSLTFQILNVVPLPGADEARRMCISRNGNWLFVACRHNGFGAVYALDIGANGNNPPAGLVTEIPGTTGPAEDVTEIPAAAAGGTGTQPGKLYFTIPFGAATLAVHNFMNPPASGPIALPANTGLPFGIERAPDDSFVMVGLARTGGAGRYPVAHVPVLTDTATEFNLGGTTTGRTWDVAFRPQPGPAPFMAYVLSEESGNYSAIRVSATAALVNVLDQSATFTGPNLRTAVYNRSAADDRLYFGSDVAAVGDIAFQYSPLAPPPPPTGAWTALTGGANNNDGPTDFAFMPPPPAPQLELACPKGGPVTADVPVVVRGANFGPLSRVQVGVGGPMQPTTFVDTETLVATVQTGSVPAGDLDLIVVNADGQSAQLLQFFTAFDPVLVQQTYAGPLPGLSQGYRMVSFPAYYTKNMLRQAFRNSVGPYNRSFYRVFFWGAGRYHELTEQFEESCDLAGGAFWVLTRWGENLSLDAFDCNLSTTGDTRVVPLRPGWNMISLPFADPAAIPSPLVNMAWALVDVTPDGGTWAPRTSAEGSPLLSPLFEYSGGRYLPPVAPQLIRAGRGYFVKNVDPLNRILYLLFVNSNLSKPSVPSSASAASSPVPSDAPPPAPGELGTEGDSDGCGLGGFEVLAVFLLLRRRRKLGA